jgi:antagonist of KipI
MRTFRVVKPGLFTTVQDTGRYGYLRYGVPVSGAMDQFSMIAANRLVENDPNVACLETTLIGPELEVLRKTQIAITGGNCEPKINGVAVAMWRTLAVEEGDVLSFGRMQSGCRGYVAIRGGIDVLMLLGSRSTYVRGGFGGIDGRQLKAGDTIEGFAVAPTGVRYEVSTELVPKFANHCEARVILGPQADMFTEEGIDMFLSNRFTVTLDSDRMGYRLEGPIIEHRDRADIVSDALLPGAVQVPKSGKPILIMRDAQTTGGYPKIAAVINADLSLLGQAKPNDTIRFFKVTLEEAREEMRRYSLSLLSLNRMFVRIQ